MLIELRKQIFKLILELVDELSSFLRISCGYLCVSDCLHRLIAVNISIMLFYIIEDTTVTHHFFIDYAVTVLFAFLYQSFNVV